MGWDGGRKHRYLPMSSKFGYSCFVTTSNTDMSNPSEAESPVYLRASAPARSSCLNTPPYPPYFARASGRGVSASRIAMRRGGGGMLVLVREMMQVLIFQPEILEILLVSSCMHETAASLCIKNGRKVMLFIAFCLNPPHLESWLSIRNEPRLRSYW